MHWSKEYRLYIRIYRLNRPHDGGRFGDDDDEDELRLPRRRQGGLGFHESDEDEELEGGEGDGGAFSFHVFTNPLEMEKFFDSQMDQILRGFGFGRGLGEEITI